MFSPFPNRVGESIYINLYVYGEALAFQEKGEKKKSRSVLRVEALKAKGLLTLKGHQKHPCAQNSRWGVEGTVSLLTEADELLRNAAA